MKFLLTDPHVARCVTLLALMQQALNPVELDRYQQRYMKLLREHPELAAIFADDPRVTAAVQEIREAFEPTPPAIPARSTEQDKASEIFDAADDALGEYSDTEEGWKGYR